MALAIDASTPARFSGTDIVTSASFTPPTGAFLVACVNCNDNGSTGAIPVMTSSPSLTWTTQGLRNKQDTGGLGGTAAIFTAVAGSGAMTASADNNRPTPDWQVSCKLYVVTGQDATTPMDVTPTEGSSTTNNLSASALTTATDGAWVFGAATDWAANGVPTSTDVADGWDVGGIVSGCSVRKSAATSPAGAVTLNFDAGGTGAATWNWVAIAVRPAAAAATTSAPIRSPYRARLPLLVR